MSLQRPFLRLNNITALCLSIDLLMCIWVISTFWLLHYFVNSVAMNIRVQDLFENLFLLLLGTYLGVELLGHVVILCLTNCGTFSQGLHHFTFPLCFLF